MPGAGGTYLYLREAFQYRTGKLMPFLFIWTALLTVPLIMSTGIIGIVSYLGFFFPQASLSAVAISDSKPVGVGRLDLRLRLGRVDLPDRLGHLGDRRHRRIPGVGTDHRTWPFAPPQIHEVYLEEQRAAEAS
jgi:amino acid transporter